MKAPWCGSLDCEVKVKDETGADIRFIPFDEKPAVGSKLHRLRKGCYKLGVFC